MRQFQQVYALGLRALRYGQYRQAQQHLSEALRLVPDHSGARLARLRVLLALGYLTWNRSLVQKAQSDARHVLRIDPNRRPTVNGMPWKRYRFMRRPGSWAIRWTHSRPRD